MMLLIGKLLLQQTVMYKAYLFTFYFLNNEAMVLLLPSAVYY